MKLNISLSVLEKVKNRFLQAIDTTSIGLLAILFSLAATMYSFVHDYIVLYGDAESHLNIAKRVIDSITPGVAQLGGIWLPIPHILLIPFVTFNPLWRTGLAGSIVSGAAFVVATIYLYKSTLLITKNKLAGFIAALVFMMNPNILYLQSTPMTEMVLIMFFVLSSYYFIKYILDDSNILALIISAGFTFFASLSRYDGWFLAVFQAFAIFLLYARKKSKWREMEGKLFLFCTLAFFGILLWMMWDQLILGNAFYFTNSQFSAKTQQENWHARGELPGFHDLPISLAYYFVTTMSNAGVFIILTSLVGLILYLRNKNEKHRFIVTMILAVPFIFNVVTLFLGQSVIFIPHLTPVDFEWRLFNVRYGVMAIPLIAYFFGYIFYKVSSRGKLVLSFILVAQLALYQIGYSKVISLADGIDGLSHAKRPDAEGWIRDHYDYGLVLLDDYARTVSIVRSGIPMQNTIYIGNKPYWEESLYQPEKYARWIVMQKNDAVWEAINVKQDTQGELYKYFEKAYTSEDILIFKRNNVAAQ
jgi:hypothetical protein